MIVFDERGDPVVVEYIGPRRYLASGWWGGVGRYARGTSPEWAVLHWECRLFLPKRVRRPSAGPIASPAERLDHIVRKWGPALERLSDERPGGRPEEEE